MNKLMNIIMFVAILTMVSCESIIPETDNTEPTFSFKISGNGFNKTFTQDDDFSRMQLNLKYNTMYSFVYSGADSGGVELIQWQLGGENDIDFVRPDFPVESWTIRNISPNVRMIEWTGDRTNPRTGGVLTGNIRTGNDFGFHTIRFFVRDFGGQSGTPNMVQRNLSISFGDNETNLETF